MSLHSAVLLLIFCCLGVVFGSTKHFLVLGDLHVDEKYSPLYADSTFCRPPRSDGKCIKPDVPIFAELSKAETNSTSFAIGRYNCDSPRLLVDSLYSYIKEQLPIPEFILVVGDWVSHCSDNENDVLETLASVSEHLHEELGRTVAILPVLGNNDLFPHNSMTSGPCDYLNSVAEVWSPWLCEEQQNTFRRGGYYTSSPILGLRVLVMNTMYYYTNYCPYNTTLDKVLNCAQKIDEHELEQDPSDQFVWLSNELLQAERKGEKVYITSHIGPQRGMSFMPQWRDIYQERFYNIIERYFHVVEGLLFGHTHVDAFGLLDKPNQPENVVMKPVFANPSVTPYDRTNPMFRMYDYDTHSLEIIDYENHYLDLSYIHQLPVENWTRQMLSWQWEVEYRFSSSYQMSRISDLNMNELYHRLHVDLLLMKQYTRLYYGLAQNQNMAMKHYLCAIHVNKTLCKK